MNSFASIATSVCPRRASSLELRMCPDVYVSRPEDLLHPDEANLRLPVQERASDRCVILVLESPHKDEFMGTPNPAKGQTGKFIAKYLRSVAGLESVGELPLVLINAVQYQCSLGEKPSGGWRDEVFMAYWNQGGRIDFTLRLRAVFRAGDILVCCCTRGDARDPKAHLRQRVYEAMQSAVPHTDILRRNHPCTWNIGRNRRYNWKAV